MNAAWQKDEAFVADVRRVLAVKGRALWWLGQSGFLVVQNGRALVLDPYLSDSLTRKYSATDKPHVRMTELVVAPEILGELGVIDVVTSSHNHTDHFDSETLLPLLAGNPHAKLIVPAANLAVAAERLGPDAIPRLVGIDAGQALQLAGMEIHGIAAAHNTVERDEMGRCRFLGVVVRWGGLTLYHSGDTVWHEGLVPALRRFAVDIALLPINGDHPERRVAGNLDGIQAARLAKAIAARAVIPCHFDLFEFNTASPDEFIAESTKIQQPYRVLQNGEGWDLGSIGLGAHLDTAHDPPAAWSERSERSR